MMPSPYSITVFFLLSSFVVPASSCDGPHGPARAHHQNVIRLILKAMLHSKGQKTSNQSKADSGLITHHHPRGTTKAFLPPPHPTFRRRVLARHSESRDSNRHTPGRDNKPLARGLTVSAENVSFLHFLRFCAGGARQGQNQPRQGEMQAYIGAFV